MIKFIINFVFVKLFSSHHERIKHSGFSLIEILIATSILSVGLIGVAQFQVTFLKESTLAKQRNEAMNLANIQLEKLAHHSGLTLLTASNGSYSKTLSTATFDVSWQLSPSINLQSATISVKVTWLDYSKNNLESNDTTVYLNSIISNTSPLLLALTRVKIAPGINKEFDPDEPDRDFPNIDDVSSDGCNCNNQSVSQSTRQQNKFLFKVSSTNSKNSQSSECQECCEQAGFSTTQNLTGNLSDLIRKTSYLKDSYFNNINRQSFSFRRMSSTSEKNPTTPPVLTNFAICSFNTEVKTRKKTVRRVCIRGSR